MRTIFFQGATLYSEMGKIENPLVCLTNGKLENIAEKSADNNKRIDEVITFHEPVKIIPGFIDVHIHGAAGADVMDGTLQALETMKQALPKEGTTSFLATTMTQSVDDKIKALKNVRSMMSSKDSSGAEILGVHLEGPFISDQRAGAQPLKFIQKPSRELFNLFQEASGNAIKLITMAPEEDDERLVEELLIEGVLPSIGHSDATYKQMKTAIEDGFTHVTHLFNGMRGVHHRDIGVAGASLLHDELIVEMIVDGIHISPPMVKLAYKNKGADKIVLITDAMRAKGMQPGNYSLGGQQVQVDATQAKLADGTLAGSIIKMNEAVRNMQTYTGCSFEEAVNMATINPAKQLKVDGQKGSLRPGKDADFCVVNDNLDILQTYVKGTKVFG
ncbi:N-acetylglucosamine-6-phosphate deacetylase [Salipaludibacillus neizhouensis]|uniref:N-acetylglucosamine-6-phosphate deacetylase n=1 Tax=Salipaludibacillus neizhouensis TaxID=885475 RepID=A0A3A9K4A3_9BACI|nr:N-acetylglucosamine-6-phosphate deacetylase [Salipaludibacillus neizhouensis]RKL65131.1 N-acetylglucosamine-6-phosphate deacetylase [Salipaludibacillus neizhouensis]